LERGPAAVVSARAIADAVGKRLGFDDAKFRRLVEAGVADRLDRATGRVTDAGVTNRHGGEV